MASDPSLAILNMLTRGADPGITFLQAYRQAEGDGLERRLAEQRIAANDFALNVQRGALASSQATAAAFRADVEQWRADPTPEGLAQLMVRYPDQAKELQKPFEALQANARAANFGLLGRAHAALANGRADVAVNVLRARQKAEAARGADTSEIDEQIRLLESGDKSAVAAVKGGLLAALAGTDPDKFGQSYGAVSKEYEGFTLGNRRYDAQGNLIAEAPYASRYEQVPIFDANGTRVGTQIVEIGGGNTGGGDPVSGGTGSAGGSGAPRSVRNNNPGNLRASGFTRNLPGYRGVDSAGYAIFDNPQAGQQAQQRLLGSYLARGFDTVDRIIERWAPRASKGGDNTEAQTDNYKAYVARRLGIAPGDKIGAPMLPQLAQAMAEFESGNTGGPVRAGGAAPAALAQGAPRAVFTQQAAASEGAPGDTSKTGEEYLKTIPPALAAQVRALAEGRLAIPRGAALRSPRVMQLYAAASQYDPTLDEANAQTRVATRKDFTSGKSAQSLNAINTVMGHFDDLDHAIDDLRNFDAPWLNTVTGAVAYNAGDKRYQVALKKFEAAKAAVARELTRAYRGTGGNVSDIEEFEKQLSSADSPAALHATVRKYVQLLGSKIQALGDTYNQGMGRSDDPLAIMNSRARKTYERLSGEGAPRAQVGGATGGGTRPRRFRLSGFQVER